MARLSRRFSALGLLGAAGLALAACGSDYRYVNNSSEKTFFRVPASMEVFRVRDEAPEDRPTPAQMSAADPWRVVFDAGDDAQVEHVDAVAPKDVVGQAMIIPVSFDASENLSVKQARAFLAGGDDPLDLIDQGDSDIELVSFQSITEDSGLTGSRIVYSKQVGDDVWTTYDQTSLVDIGARKVYLFEVKCESSCFKEQQDQISKIVDSWQVRT
jgi:hypothetical protein